MNARGIGIRIRRKRTLGSWQRHGTYSENEGGNGIGRVLKYRRRRANEGKERIKGKRIENNEIV